MFIKFSINERNIGEISSRVGAIKNPKHLKLLLYVSKNPTLCMDDIHLYSRQHHLFLNRQSTHKALEKLVKAKFLRKQYDEIQSKIVYSYNS